MDWEKLFKRYVWDDDKTPYFTAVGDLNRRQADNEIFVFSLFMGVLLVVFTLASLSPSGPHGRSFGLALYGFSVVCAAAIFALTKSVHAALYLGVTPLAALGYLFFYGFASERALIDSVLVTGVLVLLQGYSFRIVAIARAYPRLPPPGNDDDASRLRRPFRR